MCPNIPNRLTVGVLADDDLLEQAFSWLCTRRRRYPPHADVWRFRRDWPDEKERLQNDLRSGDYCLGTLDRVTCVKDGRAEDIDLWPARDAVVLKALSLLLPGHLPLPAACTHLKGHGGAKYAVRLAMARLPGMRFVLKTDVQSYYASIDHHLLLERLAPHVRDRVVLNLIGQYLRRVAERGGVYKAYRRGLPLGSPLSPILGAFFLAELNEALARGGWFHVRFMDDILVLAPTRWRLRRAVRVVNEVLATLDLRKHPDKTFIGRIDKGFDWLGYRLPPDGQRLAARTVANFAARITRLYEHTPGRPDRAARRGEYVRRWLRWAAAGLGPRFDCPVGRLTARDHSNPHGSGRLSLLV